MKVIDTQGHELVRVGTPLDTWHAAPKGYVDAVAAVSPGSVDSMQRVLSSPLPNVATALTVVSGTAYFVYMGLTSVSFCAKFVEFYVSSAGTGTQVAEVGLFTSASAPNKSAMSLSAFVTTTTVTALSSTGVKRNSVAFGNYLAPATHLWAGVRIAMTGTQPALSGLCMDWSQGRVLSTPSAASFGTSGPWTGGIIGIPGYLQTAIAPDLRLTLD